MLRNTVLALTMGLILIASCSEAPVEQIQTAQTALDRAKRSEAESYATETYKMAADTLNAAMAAKEETDSKFKLLRNYHETERLVARARQLANEAAQQAESEKEQIRLEVADLITTAQAVIDSADVAIKKAPQGKGTKADIDLIKNDLATAKTVFADAKADFDAGKVASAKAKLETAITKARGVSNEIMTAISKKAKM